MSMGNDVPPMFGNDCCNFMILYVWYTMTPNMTASISSVDPSEKEFTVLFLVKYGQ